MPLRKIPSAGTPIGLGDLLHGFGGLLNAHTSIESFENEIKNLLGVGFAFAVNSGTTAIYIALEVFKKIRPDRKKVIIPAYTAPVVRLPIERAGLDIILCEVSRETFNMDLGKLPELLSEDVLCVMPVHLFGIPTDIEPIKGMVKDKGIFILEDAAQSLGSRIDEKEVGSLGDIGILSFHRGKNLSTYSGGVILTNSPTLAGFCVAIVKGFSDPGTIERFGYLIKLIVVSQIVKPWVYGLLHPLVEPFKSRDVHYTFNTHAYTGLQAGVGLELLKSLEGFSRTRYEDGMLLAKGLEGIPGITTPKIRDGIWPAFNQFPLVLDDTTKIDPLISSLWDRGIETTRLYLKPMHRIFDLGLPLKGSIRGYTQPDPFPVASWLAEGLLLIPTHPYMTKREIEMVIDTIRKEITQICKK